MRNDDDVNFVFQCNATRDALAKALYCRTVATIVRRANSLRKPMNATTMSTESTDSAHLEVRILMISRARESDFIT